VRLFYYPHAPYSRKVLLAAYERGVSFERELSLPWDGEHRKKLRAVHPLATLPLLEDGDDLVTESSLEVEWIDLAGTTGERLVPGDAREAIRVRSWDRFGDSHLMGPTVYLAWSLRKPVEQQNPDKIASQRKTVDTALTIADRRLQGRSFLAGDRLSMADLSSFAALSCMLSDKTLADLATWPSLAAWYERVASRPSFAGITDECATVPLPPGF
jgi:glutathione S-transferase